MEFASNLVAAAFGGFVAGAVALAFGGLGVLYALHRQVRGLADALSEVARQVEREVKRRAADVSVEVKKGPLAATRAQLGPLSEAEDWLERQRIMRGERRDP